MIKNYFKIAWRNLVTNKSYTFINIGGLSLGFACSILIYLFVSHHLQYDSFHDHSDRIYRVVTEEHRDMVDYEASVPPGFAYAFRTEYDYAEKVAKLVDYGQSLISLEGNKKLQEDVYFVESDFFEIFNLPLIDNSQVSLSDPNLALITESMAQKMFGNENPVGKTFKLEGAEVITLTGVLQDFPKTSLIEDKIFVSYPTIKKYSEFLGNESGWGGISSNLQCFTLLRPDQNVELIEQNIAGFVKKYRPTSKNVHHYKLQALADIHFDARYSGGISTSMLWIFSLIGFFLLLMASINFINISTAQSITRSKEVGIRKVLGGLKIHLFSQFLAETFILSFLSLVLGFAISLLALPYFNSVFGMELSLDELWNYQFAGFAITLLLGISLLAGSYPGVLLAKIAPVLALKGKITQKDAGGFMIRKVLVTLQFVISIILIVGTIVINKQMKYAINSDLGFEKTGIVRVALPDTLNFVRLKGLKDRIARFSGVEKISACFATPGAADNSWGTSVRYNHNPEAEEFSINVKVGDEDYLNTFGLELVAGRNFYVRDTVDEILVNVRLAEKLGLDNADELLGKHLNISGGYIQAQIVGVVANFHDKDFHEGISPIFIGPVSDNYTEFAIKINLNNTRATLDHIEKEWSAVFPEFIFEYEFLHERVEQMYETEQRFLSLSTLFSSLAIFIGCLGIYGLILFLVLQKTKEIGIRKVLGSTTFNVLMLVMEDFVKLVAIAGLVASPIAWYFMFTWLQNYTYQTELSWWVFAIAISMVMLITLLTISYQAIKAARANPINSLRAD